MKTKIVCLLITIFLFLIAASCTSTVDGTKKTSKSGPLDKTPDPETGIIFPRQEPGRGGMEALTSGTLVLEDNCFRLYRGEGSDSYTIIWPPNFRLSIEQGMVQIRNSQDQVVAHIGDKIQIGGGEVPALWEPIKTQVPPQCPGKYWIMGNEKVTILQKIIFPTQELINGERVSMDGLAQGTLVASDSCIRLKGENSDHSLMIVWPPNYKYSIEEGIINILNGEDEIVAKVSDKVKISGGGVEIFSLLPKHIQDQVPSICTPPYWIMGDEIYLINGDSK